MKKRINILIFILIAGTLMTMSFTRISSPETPIDQRELPQEYDTLYVSLGEEFTLCETQTAIVQSENFSITVKKFFNSPCPPNVQCIWSGVGIAFEYAQDDDIAAGTNLVQAFGLQTKIIDTDYESFVKLRLTKND